MLLLGDIWKHRRARDWIVVSTNVGWRRDGTNVMGRGIAAQAARKFPDLPAWYGAECRKRGSATPTIAHPLYRLILFPVKPLNPVAPHLSWKGSATLARIQTSLDQLLELVPLLPHTGRVLIPAVGCGNGGLDPPSIVSLLINTAELRCSQLHVVLDPGTAARVPCHDCLNPAWRDWSAMCPTCRGSGTALPTGWRDPMTLSGFDPDNPLNLNLEKSK